MYIWKVRPRMPPKFAMAKAKAKAAVAKAKAKAVAKAKAKAKAAAAPMMIMPGGMAVAVPRVTQITGCSMPGWGMGVRIYDTTGSTECVVRSNALAVAFGVNTAEMVRPNIELEPAVPNPKGIGKGVGPWAPALNWQVTADAAIETTGGGPAMSVTEIDVVITQDALQFRLQ